MYYMKQQSNKKQIIAPSVKQKTKNTSISAKTSAPVKKKTDVLENKIKPVATIKTSVAKSKTQKLKSSASTRKVKIDDAKMKQNSSVQKIKSIPKTAKPKISDVKAETKTAKTSPVVPAKKNQAAKHQKIDEKVKAKKSKKKFSVKKVSAAKSQPAISAKKKTSENKKNNQIFNSEKTTRLPTNTTIKKAQTVKSQPSGKIKKTINSQTKTLVRKVQPKTSKVKSNTIVEKKSAKQPAEIKKNKVLKTPVKVENKKLNFKISKLPKVEEQKIVAVHLVKKLKLPENINAPKNKKISRPRTVKPTEIMVEPPVLTTSKLKKAKAISSAVFRGAKNRYDFTVFPLDAVFENVPAIYIISRRVVDKSKKAHHALVYIGQTESLLDELKKHKKDKRAKKFAANSISLLQEENENRRLKIETDLKAAHSIRCLHA